MVEGNQENEFSRLFNLELTQKYGTKIEYVANEQECEALASRFLIPRVYELRANCEFRKLSQKDFGDYKLSVNKKAKIIQKCVITLNELNKLIEEDFSIIFKIQKNPDKIEDLTKEVEFEVHEEDVEMITDKTIDVGEYIAEYLSLSMEPYPRQENVKGNELGYKIISEVNAISEEKKANPFSVLKELKHKT